MESVLLNFTSIGFDFPENTPFQSSADSGLPADENFRPTIPDQNAEPSIKPTSTASRANSNTDRHTFDSLPVDVLYHIFSYLKPSDLVNISKCSPNLSNTCSYSRFWRRVHDVCNGYSTFHCHLLPFLNESTTSLHLSKITELPGMEDLAAGIEDLCFEGEFFESLNRLSNLKTFILENHILDRDTLKLEHLPTGLTELRLNKIDFLGPVDNSETIFDNLDAILPNLEIVDVSNCEWVLPEVLEPLSKFPHLKELKLVGCRRMRDISDYASISTNLGFHRLETLDLRFTEVTFSEILIFRKLRSLKEVLLEQTLEEAANPIKYPFYRNETVVPILALPQVYNASEWLEKLVLHNCPQIRNEQLTMIEINFLSLKYLDIRGSSCTPEAVAVFQSRHPDIELHYTSRPPFVPPTYRWNRPSPHRRGSPSTMF